MDYVFRFLFGFAVTFVGCELAILITHRRIEKYKLEGRVYKERLTRPESYIWVTVEHHPPEQSGDYLVEYYFEANPESRFHSVHWFDVHENRFTFEGFHGLKIVRWAELPK